MDVYLELFMLRNRDRDAFNEIFGNWILQHLLIIYVLYLLYTNGNPIILFIFAIYSEIFTQIYLTQKLHEAWRRRYVEE